MVDRILIALSPVALSLTSEFKDSPFSLISQDLSNFAPGAHTGQTTLEQLKDLGVVASLVGHSERRTECGESDLVVTKKLLNALQGSLEVILCFGEDLSEREGGRTREVLERQLLPLKEALSKRSLGLEGIIFAYEPI